MVRILCLHGFAQSGAVLNLWCKELRRQLELSFGNEPVELVFPNGSLLLTKENSPDLARIPAKLQQTANPAKPLSTIELQAPRLYGWNPTYTDWTCQLVSFDGFVEYIRPLLEAATRSGTPFDGVCGFSQGAAYATPLSSLLESGVEVYPGYKPIDHPAFKFQLLFSGCRVPSSAEQSEKLFSRAGAGVSTPTMNWYWPEDKIIPQGYTFDLHAILRNVCHGRHYEGHRVPRNVGVHVQSARFVREMVLLARAHADVDAALAGEGLRFADTTDGVESLARACHNDVHKSNVDLAIARMAASITDAPLAAPRL
ncbi:hypothetical protein PYCC9005_004913 [Savitreella phatthalungensis]